MKSVWPNYIMRCLNCDRDIEVERPLDGWHCTVCGHWHSATVLVDAPNPPVTASGGYQHETRGFKMKAAYDKTHSLHLEPVEAEPDHEDSRRDHAQWRVGYRDGFRDGGVLAAFIVGLIVLIGFVFYVGCR